MYLVERSTIPAIKWPAPDTEAMRPRIDEANSPFGCNFRNQEFFARVVAGGEVVETLGKFDTIAEAAQALADRGREYPAALSWFLRDCTDEATKPISHRLTR